MPSTPAYIEMMNKPQLPKGHASILSPGFKYVPAANTDLAKTFARIWEQHRAAAGKAGTVSVLRPKRSS